MSPRAAWRLETLGITNVYGYVAGKSDWIAAGLPREGKLTSIPRAGDVARPDLTCRATERISDVIERIRVAGKDRCIVTTDGGVVLGRVRTDRLDGVSQGPVEEVMELGPTTTRADTMLESILERLNARNVERILVATSDGQLVGTLHRSDAEARLHEGQVEEAEQPIDEESCCCCKD